MTNEMQGAGPTGGGATRPRFEGHVAFVTGAGRGFGAALSVAFAAEGAAVAVVDVDEAAAATVVDGLTATGARAVALRCDVSDEEQVDAAVAEACRRLGDVSVLVNNAGLHLTKYSQPFSVLERSDIRALFEVNVMGIVNCTLSCAEPMRRRGGGAVLNLSSLASYEPSAPYAVSKLAVRGLTTAFASELGGDGIRVNALAPGLMASESALADLPAAMVREFVERKQSVHRLGTVEDVVAAVLFLCSGDAGFVTSETLRLDGGAYRGL